MGCALGGGGDGFGDWRDRGGGGDLSALFGRHCGVVGKQLELGMDMVKENGRQHRDAKP